MVKNSIIKCSNEHCYKDLFVILTDIEKPQIYVDTLQSINIDKDKLPKKGNPMICNYCKCRFIIEIDNGYKIHTNNGWVKLLNKKD